MSKTRKIYYITKWIIIGLWRVITGRWFIFKDAPIAVVRYISMFGHTFLIPNDPDPYMISVIQEAQQESKIRQLNKYRNI